MTEKRKRQPNDPTDVYGEFRALTQLMRRRQRSLLIHRTAALLLGIAVWIAWLNLRIDFPAIPLVLSFGMILLYISHEQFVKTQDHSDSQLRDQLLGLLERGDALADAVRDDYATRARLVETDYDDDELVYDADPRYNSRQH